MKNGEKHFARDLNASFPSMRENWEICEQETEDCMKTVVLKGTGEE